MPPVEAQENVKIGTFNKDGDQDVGLVDGPISEGVKGGVIEAPKKENADEQTALKWELTAGRHCAWACRQIHQRPHHHRKKREPAR